MHIQLQANIQSLFKVRYQFDVPQSELEFKIAIVSLRNRISQKVLSNSSKYLTNHNVLINTGALEQQEVVSERTNIGNEGSVHGEAWMEELPQEGLWDLDVLEDPWRWLLTEDEEHKI